MAEQLSPEDTAILRKELALCVNAYQQKGLAPEDARQSADRFLTAFWNQVADAFKAGESMPVVLQDIKTRTPHLFEACGAA